jgi:hypothetical protein
MKFFAKIEHVFTVAGRGRVIVPFKAPDLGFPLMNDRIQLRGPAGAIDTHVAAIESLNVESGLRRLAILVPEDVANSDISSEMEIWIEPSN